MEDNKKAHEKLDNFYAKNYTPRVLYYPFWITKNGFHGSGLPRDTQEEAIQYLEKRLNHDKEQWICKMVTELVWEKNLEELMNEKI